MSSSDSPRQSPEPQDRPKPHKIFVTNLDVEIPSSKIEAELQEKFARFGKLDSVVVKKSFNNEYSFAFIEYQDGEDASDAVKELNNTSLYGKKMKVELQDNSRRRKGGNETCFVCGKAGHYARNCRQNKDRQENGRNSRSESRHRKRSRKHKRSKSSESRSERRKDKKKHSRKIKKSKHKKERRGSSDSSR